MKKSRYTPEQVAFSLRQGEGARRCPRSAARWGVNPVRDEWECKPSYSGA